MRSKKVISRINPSIESMIFRIRGERIILDKDLASVYGVSTKRLNEQVKRNKNRFPNDFCFQLSTEELDEIVAKRSLNAAISKEDMRSHFATASKRNIRFMPFAFTEHGAIMAANVLNSERAVEMSVFVVRAFIKMRGLLSENKELARKQADLERELKNDWTSTKPQSWASFSKSRPSSTRPACQHRKSGPWVSAQRKIDLAAAFGWNHNNLILPKAPSLREDVILI